MENGKDIQKLCNEVHNHQDGHRGSGKSGLNDNLCQTHDLRMRTRIGRRYPTPSMAVEKVRHKRHTMKNMAKPLKQWLYHHKDYPYPNRKEKLLLSVESTMTLVQVSNWFANARRRLKNTVHDPRMTWEQRIYKYNKHVTGNAERLSISSGDTSGDDFMDGDGFDGFDSDDNSTVSYAHNRTSSSKQLQNVSHHVDDVTPQGLRIPRHPLPACNTQPLHSHLDNGGQTLPTHKYKNSIMQRYLNDSYHHAQKLQIASSFPDASTVGNPQTHMPEGSLNPPIIYPERTTGCTAGQEWSKFRESGSVSSHEYERMSTSPEITTSSSVGRHRQRHYSEDYSLSSSSDGWTSFLKDSKITDFKNEEDEETYWQEIIAAVALTNMARSRQQGK